MERSPASRGVTDLRDFVSTSAPVVVLTGAGCSTDSGIPAYRDLEGSWMHPQPMRYQTFVGSEWSRKRYWARSLAGWDRVSRAQPNPAHAALAKLEDRGLLRQIITQNVDGLHQKAGSRRVIDLHGRLDSVRCVGCDNRIPREDFQSELRRRNPGWSVASREARPDGDSPLEADFDEFDLPACRECDGILKPDVVFFGESVPRPRLDRAMAHLAQAGGLLVVGSSLMVWSGYRFVRAAKEKGIAVALLNRGKTRADADAHLKLDAPCSETLSRLLPYFSTP